MDIHNIQSIKNYIFKIVIVGESGVGKSSIIKRFAHNQFSLTLGPTMGVEYEVGKLPLRDRSKDSNNSNVSNTLTAHEVVNIRLQIWDTGGVFRFRSIVKTFYRDIAGAIVVFDVTDRKSFDNVRYWNI